MAQTSEMLRNTGEEANGFLSSTAKKTVAAGYEAAKLGLQLAGAALGVSDGQAAMNQIAAGVQQTAKSIRSGPVGLIDYIAEKSVRAERLRKAGRYFEAGEVWGDEGATVLTAGLGALRKLSAAPSKSIAMMERADAKPSSVFNMSTELERKISHEAPDRAANLKAESQALDIRLDGEIGSSRKDGNSQFNPTGGKINCVDAVCAFLNTIKTKSLHTAVPDSVAGKKWRKNPGCLRSNFREDQCLFRK